MDFPFALVAFRRYGLTAGAAAAAATPKAPQYNALMELLTDYAERACKRMASQPPAQQGPTCVRGGHTFFFPRVISQTWMLVTALYVLLAEFLDEVWMNFG